MITEPEPPASDDAADGAVNPKDLDPATPEGVAKFLGGGDGDGNDYEITKAIIPNGETALDAAVPAGAGLAEIGTGAVAALDKAGDTAGLENLALSLTDFNIFRLRVVSAFNQLDNKVREITKLLETDLTCPT